MTVYQQKLGPNFAVWPICVDSILFDHDGFSIRQSEVVDGGSYGGKETFNKSRSFLVIFDHGRRWQTAHPTEVSDLGFSL